MRGAVTMYGNNGTTAPSIWDAFPYDDETIKRNAAGKFYAVGGGGSGTGGGISIADVESYLTTNGYATQDWVTGKGYFLVSNFTKANIKSTLGISDWALATSEPSYAWSEITSRPTALSQFTDDVVAGKYLPLSGGAISRQLAFTGATFPHIYGDGSKLILSYANLETYGSIVLENNALRRNGSAAGMTLGTNAYKWAHIYGNGLTITDAATFASSVTATTFIGSLTGNADSATILKTSAGHLYARAFNVDKIVNIGADATFQGYSTYIDGMYIRFRYGSANATAMQIGTDGNVAIGGTTASDKLYVYGAISSENANADAGFRARGSAYSLFFGIGGGNVNRGIYDDYHKGWWIMRGAEKTTTIDGSMVASGLRINQTAFDDGLILNRTAANLGVGIVAMSNNVCLGTFGINGTKIFEISGGNGIVAQVSTETGNAMIIHGGGSYKEGIRLANRNGKTSTWSGIHLGCDPSATEGTHSTQWLVGRNGNNNYFVVRNNTTDYLQIDLSGNMLIKGAITMYYSSDKRLKQNIRKVDASKTLMSLGGVYQYEYIDSEVQKNSTYGGLHYGLIYQNVKGTALDKMCHKREDGFGVLNYIDESFLSLIAGATMENITEVEKLNRKVRILEAKVEQLESRA
ncbi:MAG: tail fiber domain-containing protein [Alistipes sp.]|nr:tail fiber domain-containing protein [Alistipes sp.]